MSIKDNVALITGAAGALGQLVSVEFAKAGAKLALVDLAEDRLHSAFSDMTAGHEVLLIGNVDVTSKESVNAMVEKVAAHYGRIDVLINIAGGFRTGEPTHNTDLKTWDFMMNLNAKSVFLVSGAVAPLMLEAGRGKIISIAARGAFEGNANQSAYAASKSAVMRLTETMAREYGGKGLRVNAIAPWIMDTQANREAMPNADFAAWVKPAQVADVLRFLASSDSDAINGAVIPLMGAG